MKQFYALLILLLILGGCKQNSNNQIHKPNSSPTNTDTNTVAFNTISNVLDSIHVEDQKYRNQISEISEEYGQESEEMRKHLEKIKKTDSSNLIVVEEILEKHGWLGVREIGGTASSTLFLVIQHSDQQTQEKYLPMMRQAVKDKKISSSKLALLEDRVGLGRGEFQVYGSQIGKDQETGEMYVMPLLDPDNVNKRRAEVGLRPIEDYINHWGLVWNAEAYKKELPKWSAKLKSDLEKYNAKG